MTPPHNEIGPDEMATVPGAVSRLASPSLPPTSLPAEVPTLATRARDVPEPMDPDTVEGTLEHTPPAVPEVSGPPWIIWAAVGAMTVAVLAALLLL